MLFYFCLYLYERNLKGILNMKNTLSENMMRFGTKNLSESAQKELIVKSIIETINEHGLHNAVYRRLLTETVVELMTSPGAAAALKSLTAQIAKGTKLPVAVMGQYYLKTESNELTDNGQIARGKVGSLHGKGIGGVGTLPVPSNFALNEGGILEYRPDGAGQFTILNYETVGVPLAGKAADIAAGINQACNLYSLTALTAMLAAHPKKAAFDAVMVAFKASASAIKPLLTGNAKAFYGV